MPPGAIYFLTSTSHHLRPVWRGAVCPEKVGFQLDRQALLERAAVRRRH